MHQCPPTIGRRRPRPQSTDRAAMVATAPTGNRAQRRRYLLVFVLCVVGAALAPHSVRSAARADATAPGATIPDGTLYLPYVIRSAPVEPPPVYSSIPVLGEPVERPPSINGDLNLALRGYISTTATLTLIDLDGPTDTDPPQLAGIFNHQRLPAFEAAHRVRDWDWSCGENGCPGEPIAEPPVTLIALDAAPGEAVTIPTRNAEIHGGGFRAMVLYATADRLTLTYTREDTPAIGYLVHLDGIAVEETLLQLYNQLDTAGRSRLPALRNGERVGRATNVGVKVAIRDTGSFMDPRSRKDWWQGYLME